MSCTSAFPPTHACVHQLVWVEQQNGAESALCAGIDRLGNVKGLLLCNPDGPTQISSTWPEELTSTI